LVVGTGPYRWMHHDPAVEHGRLRRRRSTWGGNGSGSYVITSWGEYCEEHPGDCVWDTQRGPEAEISSGDNTPPSTRNPIPSGAASNRKRPAQRTPPLHRLRTRICPSSIEATINTKNAVKKIVWPISLSVPRGSGSRARGHVRRGARIASSAQIERLRVGGRRRVDGRGDTAPPEPGDGHHDHCERGKAGSRPRPFHGPATHVRHELLDRDGRVTLEVR
jgi:hypothetical protein